MNVPPGRLIASSIWRNTKLTSLISQETEVLYWDENGIFDFYPADDVGVLFLSEADMISDETSLKRRLMQSCRAGAVVKRKVVLIQKTSLMKEKFLHFQKLAAIDLGLSVIPVNTIEETSKVLNQMVKCEGKKQANPFRIKPHMTNKPDEAVIKSLQAVPGFGGKKAMQAIERFGSIKCIINASQEDLKEAVGPSAAALAYKFFNYSLQG